MKKTNLSKNIFIAYCIILFIFVVLKFNGDISSIVDRIRVISENRVLGIWNINITPLQSTSYYFRHITNLYAFYNIAGNIVLFIPFGFLVSLVCIKKIDFFKTMLVCISTIIFIEIFQFILMIGFFDIDDIILNTLGCLSGFVVFIIWKKLFNKNT